MSDAPARGVLRVRTVIAGAVALAMIRAFAADPASAEPAVRVLDLPFKVRQMRGPGSEIATAVATSGLLPLVRGSDGSRAGAPIALVWGDEGGAVLLVENGSVTAKPIGREAVEDLIASETPRGALAETRRALDGPLSVFLTGRARAPDGGPAATMLTLRERQPLGVTAEPKPVPVATATVPAGEGAVFAPQPPRITSLAGRSAVLAATLTGPEKGGLLLVTRPAGDKASWTASAHSPSGPSLILAGVADFSGKGAPEAATVDSRGVLRLWTLAPDRIAPGPEAAGYTLGDGGADLAGTVPAEGGTDLALPVAGMPALAVVTARGPARDTLRERLRITLPAPAGTGIAALGEGAALRLVVGLRDGRVAAVALEGGQP
jgi:hypothetical protein